MKLVTSMSKYDRLKKQKEESFQDIQQQSDNLSTLAAESYRVANVAHNAGALIKDLDRQFAEVTKLTPNDVSLLFLATSLHIVKWAILSVLYPLLLDYKTQLTPNNKRLTDKAGDEYSASAEETQKLNEKKEKLIKQYNINKSKAEKDYSDTGYRTVEQILFRPVPYDAINVDQGAKDIIPKKLSGTNHRAYTLGHDPVWGWIFGPLNIITRSITFKSAMFTTFPVVEHGNKIIAPVTNIIAECDVASRSIQEDKNRLLAATIKQALHFISDKYTKCGLPIPFLSAEKALELLRRGWNSVEAEKWIKKAAHTFAHDSISVAVQFFLSYFINEVIRIVHLLVCSGETDYDIRLVEVRTRKILMISNVIASSSNVIYAATRSYISGNLMEGARVLDIGGLIETTHRIISDKMFIEQIKREYLESNWNSIVIGN